MSISYYTELEKTLDTMFHVETGGSQIMILDAFMNVHTQVKLQLCKE